MMQSIAKYPLVILPRIYGKQADFCQFFHSIMHTFSAKTRIFDAAIRHVVNRICNPGY